MGAEQIVAADPELDEVFARVNHLHAIQTQGIDDGDIDAYAQTFALDAIVVNAAAGHRSTGRANIRTLAARNLEQRRQRDLQTRHCMFTGSIRRLNNGTIASLSRVLILQTPSGGPPRPLAHVVCDDIMEIEPRGALKIQFRVIAPFG